MLELKGSLSDALSNLVAVKVPTNVVVKVDAGFPVRELYVLMNEVVVELE